MKIEKVKLTQVKVNKDNPRIITSDKFYKLVNSILVLPKMLEIRPVVVDNLMQALGGNMRLQALKEIAKMSADGLAQRLASVPDYQRKPEAERTALVSHWGEWLAQPYCYIINASTLSEDDRKQFIIKDNVQFGQWDYDKLANQWDSARLNDMGMDVWDATPQFTPVGQPTQPSVQPAQPDPSEDDGTFGGALPPELQGVDLNPAELPKIEGTDETARERIIIVYKKEQAEQLANLLGLAEVSKIVYTLDEITEPKQ